MDCLNKPIVSIVKCKAHNDYGEVFKKVKKSLDMIGGIEMVVSTGDTVLIKPNLLSSKHYTTGATTNPWIVKALVELSKAAGASKVIIGEGSAIGNSATDAFEACGYNEIRAQTGCQLVDFAKDTYHVVSNPAGRNFRIIRLPESYLKANVVINVPVMKTHDVLNVTLGIKNMKGLIHVSDKKRFHKWGLSQSVVDLAHIALPQLTVMDGTIGMEGCGPNSGDPVGLGIILSSTDTVACDRVASEIMGYSVEEIEYIKQCADESLGCFDLSQIAIYGERIQDVKRPFKRPQIDMDKLNEYGIKLLNCDACSGCNNTITNLLCGLIKKGELEKLKGTTFIYGQNSHMPDYKTSKIVKVGNCTRRLYECDGIYIPGCPPHPHEILNRVKD